MIGFPRINVYTMRPLNLLRDLSGVVALLLMPGLASATIIPTAMGGGILEAGNGSVVVVGNCINFYQVAPVAACPQALGAGSTFTTDGGSTAPFIDGNTGTIKDLNLTMAFPLVDFVTVTGTGGLIHFDLTDIRFNTGPNIGTCAAPPDTMSGASCTPANSPFSLTNGLAAPGQPANTVAVSLTVDLIGYTGTSVSGSTPYTGVFTTQLAGNIDTILSTISTGGNVTASWSATFTPLAAVPEPATSATLGVSLLCLSYLIRRRLVKH
jgi:hypothetical protein